MITYHRSQADLIKLLTLHAFRCRVLYLTRLFVVVETPSGQKARWIRNIWMSKN